LCYCGKVSNKLALAVLSQALLDILNNPEFKASGHENAESAILLVARYPSLWKKLSKLDRKSQDRWAKRIEKALGR